MRGRSSPGLECCAEALERNARERRRVASSSMRTTMTRISFASSPASAGRRRDRTGGGTTTLGGNDDDDDGGGGCGVDEGERRASSSLVRLRDVSPERSPLAIVALRPEDLDCPEDHHHHHPDRGDDVVGTGTSVTSCRISTEWNGRGECNSFADRAMVDWRRVWRDDGIGVDVPGARASYVDFNGCTAGCGGVRTKLPSVPRVGRRDAVDDDDMKDGVSEPISTAMVILFLAVVAAQVWSSFGDTVLSYCKEW